MSATTRVVDFPGAQLRATEVKGDKGLFTNVVINNVLAEAATQTLDQVTANGATTTRAISITNARPGLTQTDAALTVSGGLGVNANVVATNLIARVDGSVSDGESAPHKHGLQLFAPGGSSGASLMAGYDPTADVGYVNAARSGTTRPLCLQTRGSDVGIGTASIPKGKLDIYTGSASTPGLIIDRFSSGTYRTEFYQESNRLTIKVGDGTNAPSDIAHFAPTVAQIGTGNNYTPGYDSSKFSVWKNSSPPTVTQNPPSQDPPANISVVNTHDNSAQLDNFGASICFKQRFLTSDNAVRCVGGIWGVKNTGNGNYGGGLAFFTNPSGSASLSEAMRLRHNGNVGINTTNPIAHLDVQTTSNANEPNNRVAFGSNSFWNYIYFGTTHSTNSSGANTRVYFRAVSNGMTAPSASTTYDAVELYTNYIGYNGGSLGSDDRRKFNEVAIENACDTLNKLKPQVYDKHNFEFDEISIDEASNVSTEGYVLYNEKYVKRRVSDHSRKEAGLIAQDVFYDAPELRYLVKLSDDADPDEEKPETPEDIQDDPDYDAAGWGTESASIDYNSLIAYLVKANQELDARVRELEKKI